MFKKWTLETIKGGGVNNKTDFPGSAQTYQSVGQKFQRHWEMMGQENQAAGSLGDQIVTFCTLIAMAMMDVLSFF